MRCHQRRFLWFVLLFLAACPKSSGGDAIKIGITFPSEGELVGDALVRVQGTATSIDAVQVNGETADVVGGIWEILLPFGQGEAEVVASADGVEARVSFIVDSAPPKIVVESPERGAYLDESTEPDILTVTGTLEETGAGLEFLKVNETIIIPAVSGAWQSDIVLERGLNEIHVVARDNAGNESSDVRAIMYGTFEDPTTEIVPGFNIFVRPSGIDAVEETVVTFATAERIRAMVESRFMNDAVTINTIAFDPLQVEVNLRDGFLETHLVATNIELDGAYTIGNTTYDANVQVARVEADMEIIPSVTPEGALGVTFRNDVVTIQEQDISFNIVGITQNDADFLRGVIVDVAQFAFGVALSQDILDGLYDPDILIRKAELLGREITFQLQFDEISVFPDGMLVKTVFIMPDEQASDVREVPGALAILPGPADPEEPAGDLFFTTANYSIDRLLHGIWRAGLLNVTLSGQDFAGFELPFELTAAGLAAVLDARISTIAGPDAKATIKIAPYLPPVADFVPEFATLNMRAGEFRASFFVESDDGPVTVAVVSALVTLDVEITIDGITVELAFDTDLDADLISEPEFDLDDEKAEGLFKDLIAIVPALFSQELVLKGEADILWVNLSDPDAAVHGVNEDYASFGLRMTPNPNGFETVMP